MPSPQAKPSGWRDVFPVHPCSDAFPMMHDDDIKELAEDIRNHGVQKPIVLWRSGSDQPWQVLDGRNRLEALTRLGVDLPPISNGINPEIQMPNGHIVRDVFTFKHDVRDPAVFVISANIHRRHLTKEQRAELIIRTITAGKNDGAKVARSFNPTVGVRGGSSKDPVLTEAVQEGQKYSISKRTIQRVRAKGQGTTPTPRRKTTDGYSPGSRERQTPVTPVPATKAEAVELVDERNSPLTRQIPAAAEVMTTPQVTLTTTPRTERLAVAYHGIRAAVTELRLEKREGVAFTPADCASLGGIRKAIRRLDNELDDLAIWKTLNVASAKPGAS